MWRQGLLWRHAPSWAALEAARAPLKGVLPHMLPRMRREACPPAASALRAQQAPAGAAATGEAPAAAEGPPMAPGNVAWAAGAGGV